MKLKSFVTATLALGLLSTVGAALPSHEASADSNNGYKELTMDGKHTVPYTISVDGITALHRTYFVFPENKKVLYQEIDSKVKNELAPQRGVTTEKINNAQTATYTLTLNDGNKKVVNLKKNDDAKNSIDPSTIKQIQIVVK
ncbi:MAP domain-containing protein [Staphylococcus sp. HMSC34H10]|uniref:MAP domain-containing protein n=1 Tax=Staphylococcus sp. HMSC34H10 TaxID=1608862 RepID=UPI0008A847C6|nr:MAP domain-containing protein [Staphylococcus sp. HMSC34H10]OHR90559.1 toxin [Staphylococcus sp. HMSC34H10]